MNTSTNTSSVSNASSQTLNTDTTSSQPLFTYQKFCIQPCSDKCHPKLFCLCKHTKESHLHEPLQSHAHYHHTPFLTPRSPSTHCQQCNLPFPQPPLSPLHPQKHDTTPGPSTGEKKGLTKKVLDGVKKLAPSRFQKLKGEGDPRGGILFLGVEKEDEWGRYSSDEEEGEGRGYWSEGDGRTR